MNQGYFRHPTLHGDSIVFVSEDDLWCVPASGGTARRLTANLGELTQPRFSPDGRSLAFVSREEGPAELYVMPATGGPVKRLTYLSSSMAGIASWSRDGRSILMYGNGGQPFARVVGMYEVPAEGGLPRELPWRAVCHVAFGPRGSIVLGLYGMEPARWKRYRGGRAGSLLIDSNGKGAFHPLLDLKGQLSNPMFIGSRLHFLSDHEGVANLYSCTTEGVDLQRHTSHKDFFARHARTDGKRIVYVAGGDLWLFDGRRSAKVQVDYPSPRVQRNRKYADPSRLLEDYQPSTTSIALTTRGRLFTMAHWDGPVEEHGNLRMRLARWLKDGKRLVAITDEDQEEALVIAGQKIKGDFGRAISMEASPAADHVVIANHRHELLFVDLKSGRAKVLDRSPFDRIAGMAWSPDGKWIAYGFADSPHRVVIKLVNVKSGTSRVIARPVLRDVAPAFDPAGNYLYFLSYREFDPVYDNLHFDLGFPRGMRPYLVTLRKDLKSPFLSDPPVAPKKKPKFRIDLDGIEDRVVPFPVAEGRYDQIDAIPGAVLWTVWPVEGAVGQAWASSEPLSKGVLEKWEFAKRKSETLAHGVTSFRFNGSMMAIRFGRRLRIVKAGEKPDDRTEKDPPGRDSGWLDLSRARVLVEPPAEWAQMLREAWRLMRDHFWRKDMSGVDWKECYRRYAPLVDRVGSRSEYSDLVWEMIGELGTSHCYEMGGDYRPEPRYDVGHLGADFEWKKKGWSIKRVIHGDPWDEEAASPLLTPGANVKTGDVIVSIEGRPVSRATPPGALLLNRAGSEIALKLADRRRVTVRALHDETRARYRDWVEANRRAVHGGTKGRVGYVHVPDMGPSGYAEFHRAYLSEVDREALIIDVRYNGGGHVSQLLLEKLARKRLGYDLQRWGQPMPYPGDSPAGPLVALTNESAGSDGDIFSHCFKMMKLGPLIGKRTWGGVVGIWPRHFLVDGSVTTQPEFSFWFKDVGFGVENYGTDPDVVVDLLPQHVAAGKDPQLEAGIAAALDLLKKAAPLKPPARVE